MKPGWAIEILRGRDITVKSVGFCLRSQLRRQAPRQPTRSGDWLERQFNSLERQLSWLTVDFIEDAIATQT